MSSISENFSPGLSSAESALVAFQNNPNAIEDAFGDTFTAESSSSACWTKETHSLLPVPQKKPSLAKQRWVTWVNACDISAAEQKHRQALADQLEGRIQFDGKRIKVQGDLKCVDLTSLPAKLMVKGDLWMIDCPSITSLPESLKVREELYIENCPDLNILLEGLLVERNLWIIDCPGITRLPLSILTMPPQSDGIVREIHIVNTGITQETCRYIVNWLEEQPNPGRVQLHFSETPVDNLDSFTNSE